MATGKLGATNLIGAANTIIYSAPVSTLATVNLNLCNRTAGNVLIRVAVLDGAIGTLATADYIEYDTTLSANGVIERTGIVVANGNSIMVYSDTSNVSATCWGFEDSSV